MSSNTQIHVSARERFSVAGALGPRGGEVLCEVLQKLSTRQYPEEICSQLAWQSVAGDECSFRHQIGTYDVVLSLQGSVPRITISGVQSERTISESAMQSAHAAINQVLTLAVSDRIAQKLSAYAETQLFAVTRERVSQTVAIKALQLQNARLAIRASCGVLVKS